MLKRALDLAKEAHQGQRDKAGKPYIEHVQRVVESVDTIGAKIVAALHDVVEDTEVTLEQLRIEHKFPEHIVLAVDAITKRNDEEYFGYLARVKANPLARAVKTADLRDNMRLDRLPDITEPDQSRLEKYQEAMRRLQG